MESSDVDEILGWMEGCFADAEAGDFEGGGERVDCAVDAMDADCVVFVGYEE